MSDIKDFPLGFAGFKFSDLYNVSRLRDLNSEFWKFAGITKPNLSAQFEKLGGAGMTPPQEAEILIEGAEVLGEFIAKLFNISNHTNRIRATTLELQPIFRLKKEFLNIRVFKRYGESPVDASAFKDLDERVKRLLSHEPAKKGDEEQSFAEVVIFLVDAEKNLKTALSPTESQRLQNLCSHIAGSFTEKIQTALKTFEDWCVQVWVDEERRKTIKDWISFVRPNKIDFEDLVTTERNDRALPEKMEGPSHHLRHRDGFKLTDPRMNGKQVLREIDYCIYCHQRDKDSCTKGFAEKTGGFKKNPLGIELEGCPLDERISEMQWLRKNGDVIASLAMVMLDNPMCPGTGHRICNDCMKGCIFQKQDPVNIPQNETGVLTDVLNLPYGFEIYSLLTRFNPLNRARPYALPYNGNDVLVVGLGPAGYTLTHYLANEGFGVVGIDGLKLEPVDAVLTGRGRPFPKPIQNFSDLKKELDDRVLMGFGGVSEYGITVRWDKNFLAVIYLSLLRRKNLRFYGGVRFGGTIDLQDAWDLGFKHVGIATGAGRPTIIQMKNNLVRGVRKASDLLMALQLTGAFKANALANLQVQLPAVVIGGGLTAIDTATELMAYYPIQVEKTLDRFELLCREHGEETVWKMCDEEERGVLKTFIEHGKAVRQERTAAEKEKRAADFISLCRKWGGVSIAYRKKMSDSPAYRLNHEEVIKALEEGIAFVENMNPVEAIKDRYGAVEALEFERPDKSRVKLPAKSVCVAAGTSPNIIYEKEKPGTFQLDDKKYFFRKYQADKGPDGKWALAEVKERSKEAFFLSYNKNNRFVTFYGDNHPDFAGNVVKAMASAKRGAPHVAKLFTDDIQRVEKGGNSNSEKFDKLVSELDESLIPKVVKINRLTPTIVEVIVKGKYVAQKFEPGQFYRLQNYETSAHVIENTKLTLEGVALTGAWVDKKNGLLSMIVLEMGGSSRLCALFKPGEPVVVMGPTGTPSDIPKNQKIMLVGGGLGNAVLLSVAKALKENGSTVIYFAGYKKPEDIFKQKEIEEVTDQVIWSVDSGKISARRPQDREFTGNIVQAILSYAKGDLGKPLVRTEEMDHILAIGSDRMMAAVSESRHTVLKPYLKADHVGIASINSSMQCMMKEVCAQCLQRHVDPVTKKETFVFSCYNQDQLMDCVDFKNLNERLKMNSLAERLTNRYIDYLFKKGTIERV